MPQTYPRPPQTKRTLHLDEYCLNVRGLYHKPDFYKEAKALGFGEYRFRTSEAAHIYAQLVVLAFTLLDVLRRRLLRYSIMKSLPSVGATVEWMRKRAMNPFIHKSGKRNCQSKPYYY